MLTPAALPATAATAPATTAAPAAATPSELPPVESLSFESDFAVFLRPEVDDRIKRAALKQLFRDPRFNVMDGLDTYIDDYTRADPIAPDVLADLLQRGFGGAEEAGREAAPGVAAPRGEPGVTAGTASARAEGSAPTLAAPAQHGPSVASGCDGVRAQRVAGEAEGTGGGDDKLTDVKRSDARQ